MKKLILSAAILLISLTSMAQTTTEEGKAAGKTTTTEKATTSEGTTTQAQTPTTIPEGYTEVKLEEVPSAVTASLKKSVPEAKLVSAYINDKKQYKLQVEVGDKVGSLDADANGKWINQ